LLKSELHQLEILISEIVNYNEIADNETRFKAVSKKTGLIAEICDSLRIKWVHELFSSVKEIIILRYVQYHQAGIISLSDQVYAELPAVAESGSNQRLTELFKDAIRQLEGLLRFLEKNFYKFFDPDHFITANQLQIDNVKIREHLTATVSKLEKSDVSADLIAAVRSSILDQLEIAEQAGISYRRAGYLAGIVRLIAIQCSQKDLNTDLLSRLLFRQNFNSYYYERWYQATLTEVFAKTPRKNKESIIQMEIDDLQSRFVDRHLVFDPDALPIDNLLISWLETQKDNQVPEEKKLPGKIGGADRMPLNFSVAQLALFIRLCYLEGCFHINNISNILRFFTFHFETKKQLNISLKSFGRAFYGADQATAAVVRDFLQRMINTINKTYFP